MKALYSLTMILEVDDVEDMRVSMEKSAWDSMIASVKAEAAAQNKEFTQEDLDDAILYLGVQAWPLPHRPLLDD